MTTKKFILVVIAILATLPLAFSCPVRCEDNSDTTEPYHVPRTESVIRVDGSLDDEGWSGALVMELKYETTPGENIPAPVKSEILITYSQTHFYIAFRCFDPEPAAIRAHLSDRDSAWSDDRVVAILDTFNDQRHAYIFCTNPLGVQMDYTNSEGNDDTSWDAIWDSAGSITEWGWAVEMAIPFSSIRFPRGGHNQTWGLIAVRLYPRNQQHWFNIVPSDRNNNCMLCQAAKIEGFEGVRPGRNIEITPTLTSARTDARPDFPFGEFVSRDKGVEPGLTASWGITPNLTLSGTLNPDFSQVEADVLQLEINRTFALSYPERRPFFLEGRSFFSNLINTRINSVYTRSIADPAWGAKLTGKEGANAIGFFAARDEITNLIFPGSEGSAATSLAEGNTSSVLRYYRDIWNNSSLGLIATSRESGSYYNRLFGADGLIRFSSTDRLQFQLMRSTTRYDGATAAEFSQPPDDFTGSAYSFLFQHVSRSWQAWGVYELIDGDFRADLGFVPQTGTRVYAIGGGRMWRGDSEDLISQFFIGTEWDETYHAGGGGGLIGREFEIWINASGAMQSSLFLRGSWRRQTYKELSASQKSVNGSFFTRPTGSMLFGMAGSYGDQIDFAHAREARSIRLVPQATFNLGRHLMLGFNHEILQLSIHGRRLFLANATQSRIVYQFNARAFIRAILQYTDIRKNAALYANPIDAVGRALFTQFLFSYKLNPRTVLFIGYSDNHRGTQSLGIRQADRTFFMKIGYAWLL